MDLKLVTVCIPTYNSANFFESTIKSIINQTYKNIEIIIGDNASTDRTFEIIEKYAKLDTRITYYKNNNNIGYSKNCNKLISMAKGEYISIYHSDDIYDLSIVNSEVDVLNSNKNLLGVFTSYYNINKYDEELKIKEYPIIIKQDLIEINLDQYLNTVLIKGGSCFCCPTSMIRKEVYKDLNGYDESLEMIMDQDMWARILLIGPMGIINQRLIKYRIHAEQLSSFFHRKDRKEEALPLQHIRKFLQKNRLELKYKNQLAISEALDCLTQAILAIKLDDIKGYEYKLFRSRQVHNLGWNNKLGLIQNFPFPKLIYFIAKYLRRG